MASTAVIVQQLAAPMMQMQQQQCEAILGLRNDLARCTQGGSPAAQEGGGLPPCDAREPYDISDAEWTHPTLSQTSPQGGQ